jgi:hypothetical protein
MVSADYYRQEARRCRELAAGSPDAEAAKRWRAIAADYEKLAEAMEHQTLRNRSAPMQQQPMQQQQQKKTEDGE